MNEPKTLPTVEQPDHLVVFGVAIPRRLGGGDFGWYEGRIAGCKISVWRDLQHWSATVRGWGAEKEMKLEVVDIAPRLLEHAIMLIRRELLQLIELADPEPHEFVLDRRDPRGEVWKLPTPRAPIEDEPPETDPCPTPL